MDIVKSIAPAYEEYVLDWYCKTYLLIGGYASGKTYQTAYKIILKLYEEDRRAIVATPDKESLKAVYNMFLKILDSMGVLGTKYQYEKNMDMVQAMNEPWRAKPMRIKFHNGSKIMFRTLDQPYHGEFFYDVSILWIDEAHNADRKAIDNLKSRMRYGGPSKQYIYTANALGKDNWLYKEFFKQTDSDDYEHIIVDENELYKKKVIINDGVYYHHSTASDNKWVGMPYLKSLNKLRYDGRLYNMGRWGRFVNIDKRVLPHLEVVRQVATFENSVNELGLQGKWFFGIDDSFKYIMAVAIDVRLSTIMIFDVIPFDGQERCIKILDIAKKSNALIMMKNSVISEELKSQDYNVLTVSDGCELIGIRKLQQFKKVQVFPPLYDVYKELKGISYNTDKAGCAIYNQFNTVLNYSATIAHILIVVEVPSIKGDEHI